MRRETQAMGRTWEPTTTRSLSVADRDNRRMDAGKLQQALLEIAFGADAPDVLVRRSLQALQHAFSESAVVISLPQDGPPILLHHSLEGPAALLQQCDGAS